MRNFYTLLLSGLLLCLTAGLNGQTLGIGLSEVDGEVGETVCINIVGENFVGISGMQFSITFDTLVLEFVSAMGSINGNNVTMINRDNAPHVIRVVYAPFSSTGYTDPGPFVIGQVCFLILQEEETDVMIGSSPTPLEFTDDMGNIFEDASDVNITNGTINPGVVGTATCTDGIQNGQELGVDCGGPDCGACMTVETCSDGIMNGNETGVDCGGPDCSACPTCSDGIMNGNETGVDCGGPDCSACITCSDGIQNGNETGVDCGGPDCSACPTCSDGVQNGNETGVDCGGPDCDACVIMPTCSDGIMNGNETGVDCGGPDCNACTTSEVCGTGSNFFNLCVADACDIPVNGNFCVDVTVSMFTNITGLQFILSYPAASLDFVSFTSPALGAPLQLNEFADGNLRAIYVDSDQSGETLDDGTVLASICFTNEIAGTTNIEVASVQVGNTDGMVPGALGNDGSVNGAGCNGSMPTCTDGVQNGNETGVDCGGPDCTACVTSTCTDGIQNGNETGIDCGGPDCAACVAEECGAGSSSFNLCVEDACNIPVNGNFCVDVTVSNFTNITGLQFSLEHPAANLEFVSATSSSALGSALQLNENADGDIRAIYIDSDQSGESLDDGTILVTVCFTNETAGTTVIEVASLQAGNTNGVVVGPIGNDGTVNAAGCNGGTPTCTDGIQNGNETGVDCGGPDCAACVTPTCSDGIQNGNETGIDCGGPDCAACVAEECGAGSSSFNLCVEDACNIPVNGSFCVDVTVSNFTNITGLQFSLEHPAANLEFVSVTSPSALGSALQVNRSADGEIRAIYVDSDQSGESLDDGTVIATVCFTNETTGTTVIEVTSLQAGNTNGVVVGPIGNDGTVNAAGCSGSTPTCTDGIQNGNETGVDCGGPDCAPCGSMAGDCGADSDVFSICVGEVCDVAQNGQACVDLFAGNFTAVIGFQMDIFYPEANLDFQSFSSSVLGTELQGNSLPGGNIRIVFFNPDLTGVTVADGTSIATICFTNRTAGTTILDADNLRGSNTSGMFDIPAPVANDGMVNGCSTGPSCTNGIQDGNETGVDCGGSCPTNCPTGLQPSFNVGSGMAAIGEEVCLNVTVQDFTNLASVMMTLNYDASALQFVSITGNPSLPSFGPSSFDTNTSGQVAVNYTPSSPQTLSNGETFFTVCFNLLGGAPTNVTLTGVSVTDGGGNSLTTTTNSGTISETVSFENLTLVAGSAVGAEGTEVCIDVTVFNLVGLAGLQFAIGYDIERLSFNNATGTGALAGLQIANPDPDVGILRAVWFDPNVGSNSVPDGNSIVTVCFTVLQECEATVTITEDLPQFRIRATDANNQSVTPVDRVSGMVNAGDTDCGDGGSPPNLVLQLGSVSGEPGAEVCIDLPVTNFINLTDLSFSLSYDPTKVTFQRATNFGLSSITAANVSSPSAGRVTFNWASPSSSGESISDGNSVVSFCFIVDLLSVTPINFGNNPVTILARNGNNQAVGIIPTGGVINSDMLAISNSVLSNPICAGASNGSITLTVSGGSGLGYQWSPNVSDIDGTATGLTAGTYFVTITNGNATIEDSFTITDPGPFAIEVASVSGVSCLGEQDGQITIATVGNNGPFTFDWSGSLQDGVGVNQQTDLDGDSYSVTVTDRFGCARILNNIMVGEPMALNITGSQFKITRDAPGGVTIEITGGRAPFTYSWTGPNNYTSNLEDIDDAVDPGTYCLTVTDNNDCTDTQCFGIVRDIDITSTVIDLGCTGEDNASIDITVIGGNGNYDYIWSTEGTTISNDQDLDNVAPGDYQVMITSGECQITQTITVNAPEPILLPGIVTPAISGNNGTIALTPSGGNAPLAFAWDDGPVTQNRTGLTSGQYCVTATDGSECTVSMCYTVAEAAASILSVSTTPTSCSDSDDGTVVILINNGVAPFEVRIDPLMTTDIFADGNISLDLAGGTYTIFITDAQGAMLDTMLSVTAATAITATTTITSDTEAAGCSGMINLNIEGGTGPYTVTWSDGGDGATRSLLCAGDYTPTITDANDCMFEGATTTVGRIDEELVAVTDVACADGTEGGINVSITGGTMPYTFAWTRVSAPGIISTNEDLVASDVTGGVTAGDYALAVTDATGAMLMVNYTVGISAGFSATVGVTSNYNGFGVSCAGSADGRIEIVISGQGDFMYEYLLGDVMVGVDSILDNAAAGNYTVTVIDAGGCEITRMVEVSAPPTLVLNEGIDNISCGSTNDGSIAVEATGGIMPHSYLWSTGATTPRISGLGTGTYDVTVTDDNNCSITESYSLTAPEDLAVTFEAIDATEGCNGSVRILPLGGSGNYRFNFPQLPSQGNNPFAEGLCPGVYTVEVTDDNGCQTATMIAEVLDRRFPCLSVREVITPNGDGLNEAFVITCSDGTDAINNSLQVFNRWGQLVYRVADYDCSDDDSGLNCFEGMTNDGTILPNGPYYYIFEFTNPLGEEMQQRGSLSILRD